MFQIFQTPYKSTVLPDLNSAAAKNVTPHADRITAATKAQ
jgi:hypothetical protein